MHPKICCGAKGKLFFFPADLFMWHQHAYMLTFSGTVSVTDICYLGRKHFSWNCFPRSSWQIQWIQRLFYFYKVCTSRAETQKCSKTSGDITSEGAQIIVMPSASNPLQSSDCTSVWELLQEDPQVLQNRGWNVIFIDVYYWHSLTSPKYSICRKEKKEKEKYTFCFLRGRRAWWDAHFQCILIIHWRNLLKDTLKSYQRATEVMRQDIFYQNK